MSEAQSFNYYTEIQYHEKYGIVPDINASAGFFRRKPGQVKVRVWHERPE